MSGALSIRRVSKTYEPEGASVEALRECSFEVHAEEFVAIVGPSGCGKSTLLNAIAGFDTVSGGEIHLDGELLARPGLAPRPGPDRVALELGDHPVGRRLAALGLPAPALLSTWTGHMRGEFQSPTPIAAARS